MTRVGLVNGEDVSQGEQHTNSARIIVSATFTAEPLVEFVEYYAGLLGHDLGLLDAGYAQLHRSLLDPASEFRTSDAVIRACIIRWSDFINRSDGNAYETAANDIVDAIAAWPTNSPLMIILCPQRRDVDLICNAENILMNALDGLAHVTIISADQLFARYAVGTPFDEHADAIGHVPYTRAAFAAIATELVRHANAKIHKPVKMFCVDCDDTLWNGVVGEDGAAGIEIDAGALALQSELERQAENGRIVTLVSKNEQADVDTVFAQLNEIALSPRHVLATKINWAPKTENIRELADAFSVGDDAIVFLDDNPIECAAVRASMPVIITAQFPQDRSTAASFVDHFWPFDLLQSTKEDLARTQLYRDAAVRDQSRETAPSFAAFIDSLDLKIDIFEARNDDLTRLAQLTQRTNQFNANLKRLSENDLRRRIETGDPVFGVRVADRFGDYGLVGAIAGRADNTFEIDLLLLSCRALGRGVEHQMTAFIGQFAMEIGYTCVEIDVIEGPRNTPIREFLARLAGASVSGPVILSAENLSGLCFNPGHDNAPVALAEENVVRLRDTPPLQDVGAAYQFIATNLQTANDICVQIDAKTRTRPELSNSYVVPRPGLEATLAGIWENILNVAPIGANDAFSDLGGKSIHLVRIHAALADKTGIEIELVTLFEHSTIAELTRRLNNDQSIDNRGASVRAEQMRIARQRNAGRMAR